MKPYKECAVLQEANEVSEELEKCGLYASQKVEQHEQGNFEHAEGEE